MFLLFSHAIVSSSLFPLWFSLISGIFLLGFYACALSFFSVFLLVFSLLCVSLLFFVCVFLLSFSEFYFELDFKFKLCILGWSWCCLGVVLVVSGGGLGVVLGVSWGGFGELNMT